MDSMDFMRGYYGLCMSLQVIKLFIIRQSITVKCHVMLVDRVELEHHDMGFLFTLSSVADYRITGDEQAKQDGIEAAEWLLKRYQPKGKFIQAWGAMDDSQSYRFIVDCMLNIPLLFWASEVTGYKKYSDAAYNHMQTSIANIIRPDASSYHTFFFDPVTNKPLRGETHQGFSDDSSWARGQSWAVYGLALCYHYTKEKSILPLFERVTHYFIDHLPEDSVPYWDLIFSDGSDEPRIPPQQWLRCAEFLKWKNIITIRNSLMRRKR